MKIYIPTPLRQFTGKQATVTVEAATVGQALERLTSSSSRTEKAFVFRRRQVARLRECLPERRGHSPSGREGEHGGEGGDSLSIIPSIAGGR